jgi:hypothetical protein
MSENQLQEAPTPLGPPVEPGIPVIPQRWRLPLLLLVVASCVTIFLASIVIALTR